MSRSYSRRTTQQQDRLAQLSDDNAFVDVEAALRRMGQDVSLDRTAQQHRSSSAASTFDATGATGKRVYASRGSRASEDALLNGARVPLSASLQDQHKAYLESVRAAAAEVEDLSSSSSSSSSSVGSLSDREEDVNDSAGDADSSVVRRKGSQRAVRVVKAEAGVKTVSVQVRKRSREADIAVTVKQEKVEALPAELREGQTGLLDHVADAEADATVPRALVAKLSAERSLVDQWRRVVLEHPPQIINGVLSPEAYAPWTTPVAASAGDAAGKQGPKGARVQHVSPSSCNPVGRCGAEESVLPYPLLQLYSLCPSYEALTAAPVTRRRLERVHDEGEGGMDDTVALTSLAAVQANETWTLATMPLRRQSLPIAKRVSSADGKGTLTRRRVVRVAEVPFSISVAPHRRRRHGGLRERTSCAAGLIDLGDTSSSAGSAPVHGAGVQGAYHHHLCSVCMLPASYRCARCRTALFCSIECHVLHDATRCLKFTV